MQRYLEGNPLTPLTEATITGRDELEAELEGICLDRGEFADGVSCVSVPVLEHGIVIATYPVAAPTARFDLDRFAAAAKAAALAAAR